MRASQQLLCLPAALALAAAGGSSLAAINAEFRVVERTGQTIAGPGDNVLNFAVQARVTSTSGPAPGMAVFAFSITLTGEAESSGTLARDRTTNSDGTYFPGIAGPAAGTSSGLAGQYGYYAGINPSFNGVINGNAATWTQGTSQDIGLIVGSFEGQNLLNTPGVDVDQDGNPDTADFSGPQPHASIPQSILHDYNGADNWVDIYRFRYTITNFNARTLHIDLGGDTAALTPTYRAFNQVVLAPGIWGPLFLDSNPPLPASQGMTIQVIPAPATAAALLLPTLSCLTSRRRR